MVAITKPDVLLSTASGSRPVGSAAMLTTSVVSARAVPRASRPAHVRPKIRDMVAPPFIGLCGAQAGPWVTLASNVADYLTVSRYAIRSARFVASLTPAKVIVVPGTMVFGDSRYLSSVASSHVRFAFWLPTEYL